jgi:pimeloyl-ACP methyl ester carboxylesterase
MHGDVSRTPPIGSDQDYTRRRFLKTAAWGAAAISAAGIAGGCAGGEEKQGTAGKAQGNTQRGGRGAGGGTTPTEARAAIVLSSNPLYEVFGERGLFYANYGGADFGEVTTTAGRIGDSVSADDWHREWVATADRVAGIGDKSAAAGHAVSAREAYLRSSTYYRTSYFPLYGKPVDPRLVEAFERETDSFRKGAPLFSPPIEALEIPFEDGSLPTYFVKVDDSGKPRPTILQTNGYDSTINEMYFSHAPAAIRRGYNYLCFDGPGQGRNLIRDGIPIRPDWENVVSPVVDFALKRPEIDPDRLVLIGWSFGGYLGPRAASGEHRIAALVADPGEWDQRDAWVSALPISEEEKKRYPDLSPETLRSLEESLRGPDANPFLRWSLLQRGLWVHGVDTLHEYFVSTLDYELSPVADRISCPTLLTLAEEDPIAAFAPKLYEALEVPEKRLVRFTAAEGAGGHTEASGRALYHQRVFDWLDEVLQAPSRQHGS